ncbi:hypothetical protein JTB14_037291 [Gonioctena quinquepunctata]|nr:hypothetical protein JTB14_037291 [Gonioctena quinquepunctata]
MKESSKEEIDLLKNENKSYREQMKNQQVVMDSLIAKQEHCDCSFKGRNLIFHGIREAKNEICSELIRNLISEKLEVEVNPHEIERYYRIGKTDGKKMRPIIMMFNESWRRNKLHSKKKMLKGSGLIIREDLTSKQKGYSKPQIIKLVEMETFGQILEISF